MTEKDKTMSQTAKEIVGKAGEEILKACQEKGKVCGRVTLSYQIDNDNQLNE